jgi:hypothetical protein
MQGKLFLQAQPIGMSSRVSQARESGPDLLSVLYHDGAGQRDGLAIGRSIVESHDGRLWAADALVDQLFFLFGVPGFAVASTGCAFSSSIRELVLWGLAESFGAAFLVSGSLSIFSSSFDESCEAEPIGHEPIHNHNYLPLGRLSENG